jgi:hypothetical protein
MMAKPSAPENIPEVLQFNPRIWWDPVPWWFINQLDRNALTQIATVQLELQKQMLQAQLKSIDATLGIIGRSAG